MVAIRCNNLVYSFLLGEMEGSIFVSLNDSLISQGPQIQKIKNVNDIVVPFVGLCPILD